MHIAKNSAMAMSGRTMPARRQADNARAHVLPLHERRQAAGEYSLSVFSLSMVMAMLLTALFMSANAFPVVFQVIAFAGSLAAGCVIDLMTSGEKNE